MQRAEDAELAVLAAKKIIGRRRLYALDPHLATYGHLSPSASHPSGHAACGRVMAIVLAAIVPGEADPLFARAALYGRTREIAGTHFPSDLAAGAMVAEALFRNPRFVRDLARATAEAKAKLR